MERKCLRTDGEGWSGFPQTETLPKEELFQSEENSFQKGKDGSYAEVMFVQGLLTDYNMRSLVHWMRTRCEPEVKVPPSWSHI